MDTSIVAVATESLPTPADRQRPGVEGTSIVLADGNTWLLASDVPTLAEVWDRLYDDNVVKGKYQPTDLRVAAFYLLMAANELSPDEAARLVASADPALLVPPVERALFGDQRGGRTRSDWITVSFAANGLDPWKVPPSLWLPIMDMLVSTGRAVPEHRYVGSQIYQAYRAENIADAKWD